MIKDKIKFSAQVKPEFINELREEVKIFLETNRLSKYGNAQMVVKTIFMLLVYMGPYFLMLSGVVSSVPGVLLCWVIMGIGMAGVGMGVMHDANHGTFAKNRSVNSFFTKSLYLLGGFPPTWQHQHNTLHHGFTNVEGHDEDIGGIAILRFSPHRPLYKIHRFQYLYAWFFYGLMTISWSTIKDFGQLRLFKASGATLANNTTYRQLYMRMIFGKIFYYIIFMVIPLFVLTVPWYWVVLSFLAMHFICGVILGAIFQTAHVVTSSAYPLPDENGNIENSWAIHQLQTTSDYSPNNPIFSWLIGGLNYQVEHHLFPNISHIHYHKIAPIVREKAEKFGLPYHVHPSFYLAVGNHVKMLKNLGRQVIRPTGL